MHTRKNIHAFYIIILIIMLNVFGCGIEGNQGSTMDSPADNSSSVTLSWEAPTSDANGLTLHDLAGYKIYYGPSSKNYTQAINVGHYTGTVISNLTPGLWCFSVTAYDAAGNESRHSNEMCKIL